MSAPFQETPLASIPDLPAAAVERLLASWITTAEQLIAVGATAEGRETLSQHLSMPASQIDGLIEHARSAVDPDLAAVLEQPVDVREYGLGANEPHQQ